VDRSGHHVSGALIGLGNYLEMAPGDGSSAVDALQQTKPLQAAC
jgi:hypothetical protein